MLLPIVAGSEKKVQVMFVDVRPVVFLDGNEPLSKALASVNKTHSSVVVTKAGKYYGLIDERVARQSHRGEAAAVKCENVAEMAPTMARQATLGEACKLFFTGHFKTLPVTDGGEVIGIVSRQDLLRQLLAEKVFDRQPVKGAMSTPVVSVEKATTLAQARAAMKKAGVRRVVITDNGKIAGIFSSFDLAREMVIRPKEKAPILANKKTNLDNEPVSSFMREQVETITEDATLAEAAKRMVDHEIGTVVVSDGLKPIGMIGARDLLASVLAEEEGQARVFISGLRPEDKEHYFDIETIAKTELDKLGKTMPVDSLTLFFKKTGHEYEVRARLVHHGGKQIAVSASEFGWNAAVRQVLDELKKVAAKDKVSKLHKGRGRLED